MIAEFPASYCARKLEMEYANEFFTWVKDYQNSQISFKSQAKWNVRKSVVFS